MPSSHTVLLLLSEMGKQRDTFKDEIRNMKNDMKNNENKHEVRHISLFCT